VCVIQKQTAFKKQVHVSIYMYDVCVCMYVCVCVYIALRARRYIQTEKEELTSK
jgi:hypothetical protein